MRSKFATVSHFLTHDTFLISIKTIILEVSCLIFPHTFRSLLFHFEQNRSLVSCIHQKSLPKSVASIWYYPVCKSSACEGELNLISAFCQYETKSATGLYLTFHNEDCEAGFEQFSNVISFHVTDAIFPRRMYFFWHGEMLVKSLLMANNRVRYALFLPKLSAHILSY